jgi:inner membrane protein
MSKMELKHSIGVRLVIIVLLTFVLLIPSFMILLLISERQQRRDTVAGEISRNWGAKQTLIGPVLNIPFKYRTYKDPNNVVEATLYAHFLPERLDVNGVVNPEVRNRSIYEIVVYDCDLQLSAVFNSPQFEAWNVKAEDILWEDASISLGISDMKGVRDPIRFQWNDEAIEANPGVPSDDLFSSGVSIPVKIAADKAAYTFQTKLRLNGSFELLFSPIGKETTLHLSSAWQNPSFTGDYLPTDRKVNKNGFEADWRVLQVSRDFPQEWVGAKYEVDKSLFGVSLLLSVDQYQKTTRTVKYAIMFIALTFMTFFVLEIRGGRPIHPIQYLLIGLALLVFYTLLLSLSEYIAFGYAYFIASAGIVALISFYSMSVFADKLRAVIVAVVMIILYGYLFIILQLQDYALLMGSLILFVALALMMYTTRRVDWFSVLNHRKTDVQNAD